MARKMSAANPAMYVSKNPCRKCGNTIRHKQTDYCATCYSVKRASEQKACDAMARKRRLDIEEHQARMRERERHKW